MPRNRTASAALLALALALPAQGDTFADLRAALATLKGSSPLHATWSTAEVNDTEGRFANFKTDVSTSVEVTRDAAGLHVVLTPTVLAQMAVEGSRNPDSIRNANRQATKNVSLVNVADSLDYSDYLIGVLRRGTVVREQKGTWQQRPVRILVLAMKEEREKEGFHIGDVKYLEDQMTLWIGDDNLPLAAARSQKISAGFLIFRGTSTRKQHWSFVRSGDSLVLAVYEDQTTFSGMGQHGNGTTRQTVALH
ncbi:MAG: hypothetical protein ABI718_11560 [Acidobacteriota bacterium]